MKKKKANKLVPLALTVGLLSQTFLPATVSASEALEQLTTKETQEQTTAVTESSEMGATSESIEATVEAEESSETTILDSPVAIEKTVATEQILPVAESLPTLSLENEPEDNTNAPVGSESIVNLDVNFSAGQLSSSKSLVIEGVNLSRLPKISLSDPNGFIKSFTVSGDTITINFVNCIENNNGSFSILFSRVRAYSGPTADPNRIFDVNLSAKYGDDAITIAKGNVIHVNPRYEYYVPGEIEYNFVGYEPIFSIANVKSLYNNSFVGGGLFKKNTATLVAPFAINQNSSTSTKYVFKIQLDTPASNTATLKPMTTADIQPGKVNANSPIVVDSIVNTGKEITLSLTAPAGNTMTAAVFVENVTDTLASYPLIVTSWIDGVEQTWSPKTTLGYDQTDNSIGFSPVITAPDKVIPLGTNSVDLTEEVTVTDVEDGTVTPVVANDGGFDVNQSGTYIVTYKATDSSGNSVQKNANITVQEADVIKVGDGEAIEANHIRLTPAEVSAMNSQKYIAASNAKAWTTDGNNTAVTVATVNASQVEAKNGSYPVTYATAKPTSVTAYAHVGNNLVVGDTDAIAAEDFTVTPEEVASLTGADYVAKGKAQAWKIADNSAVAVTADFSQVKAENGSYLVTYTSALGTTTTAYVHVGKNPVIAENDVIVAEDFTITPAEVAGLTSDDYVAKAKAQAWLIADNSAVAVTADFSQVQAENGSYLVTYTSALGTETTAYVHVGNNLVVGTTDAIAAEDFVADPTEVAGLTSDDYVARSKAQAWLVADNSAVAVSADFSQVLPENGSYPVTYTSALGTKTTAYVHVGKEPAVGLNDVIVAEHFTVKSTQAAALSNDDYVAKANAKAWMIADNSPLAITVDYSKVTAAQAFNTSRGAGNPPVAVGAYPVTYATPQGTNVKANVFVVGDHENESATEVITADNFKVKQSEVSSLVSSADYINNANAKAWLKADASEVQITTVDSSQMQAEIGAYPVTYTTAAGTSVTAYVFVVGDYVGESETELITANDFTVTVSQVAALNAADYIQKSDAKAWLKADGSEVAINHVDSLQVKAAVGTYPVTYTTADGTSVTANVKVIADNNGGGNGGNGGVNGGQAKSASKTSLPNTGEEVTNPATLLSGLFIVLASAFYFIKKRFSAKN